MRFVPLTLILATFAIQWPTAFSQSLAPSASESGSYSDDTTAGLQLVLTNAISAARNNDDAALNHIVDAMRIPNYNQWFADTEYHSESWADAYGQQLAAPYFGVSLKSKFHELAQRDGSLVISRLNDGQHKPGSFEDGWMRNLKRPVNIYEARWRDRDNAETSSTEGIGFFIYDGGAFLWYSIIHEAAFQVPHGWMPVRATIPKFPYALDGRHGSGSVHLKFIIRQDGSIDKISVISKPDSTTDPLLIKSAVSAVREWYLRPIPGSTDHDPNIEDFIIRVAPAEAR